MSSLSDANLPLLAFQWIKTNLPERAVILELGSGAGSQKLVDQGHLVFSIEHDAAWIGKHGCSYIHAPIEGGWYCLEPIVREMPPTYDLLVVDGPPSNIGRRGILENLELFRHDVPWLVDDTHRPKEREIVEKIRVMTRRSPAYFNHDGRGFAVILPTKKPPRRAA